MTNGRLFVDRSLEHRLVVHLIARHADRLRRVSLLLCYVNCVVLTALQHEERRASRHALDHW
jgi:hypothetical protein